eukprot:GSMAST32.ASY1.ANO1.752.1 assembled CDS
MSTIDISLDRADRIYNEGDNCKGAVVIESPKGFRHSGITLSVWGLVKLQLSARSVGLLESFYTTKGPEPGADPITFNITPETLENAAETTILPKFHIKGEIIQIFFQHFFFLNIFQHFIVIEECNTAVKSISLQLVRVETVIFSEGEAREATEIQNIQLAEGDICRKLKIPLYMYVFFHYIFFFGTKFCT